MTKQKTIQKTDICKEIAKELRYTQKEIKDIINLFLFKTADYLCDDEARVMMKGFATLEPRKIPPRQRRNPKTGEIIEVGESINLKCKWSDNIKDRLKYKREHN